MSPTCLDLLQRAELNRMACLLYCGWNRKTVLWITWYTHLSKRMANKFAKKETLAVKKESERERDRKRDRETETEREDKLTTIHTYRQFRDICEETEVPGETPTLVLGEHANSTQPRFEPTTWELWGRCANQLSNVSRYPPIWANFFLQKCVSNVELSAWILTYPRGRSSCGGFKKVGEPWSRPTLCAPYNEPEFVWNVCLISLPCRLH